MAACLLCVSTALGETEVEATKERIHALLNEAEDLFPSLSGRCASHRFLVLRNSINIPYICLVWQFPSKTPEKTGR